MYATIGTVISHALVGNVGIPRQDVIARQGGDSVAVVCGVNCAAEQLRPKHANGPAEVSRLWRLVG